MPWRIARTAFWIAWQIALICGCAILVLMEPIVSAILIPVAHLSFLITLIFGFLIHDPHFARWGMLAFSVGALLMDWLFLEIMSLVMTLPLFHPHRY